MSLKLTSLATEDNSGLSAFKKVGDLYFAVLTDQDKELGEIFEKAYLAYLALAQERLRALEAGLNIFAEAKIGAAIFVLDNEALYVGVVGAGVYLVREGKKYKILGESDEVAVGSGFVKTGDNLMCEASSFGKGGVIAVERDEIIEVTPRLEAKPLFVRGEMASLEDTKKNKKVLFVGVALLLVLVGSIGVGGIKNRRETYRASFEEELSEARHKYDEAQSIAGLDPGRARELILESQKIIKGIQERGIEDDELLALSTEIDGKVGQIAGIYDTGSEQYLDLTLLSSNFKANRITAGEDGVVVADSENKKVAKVEIPGKTSDMVSSGEYLPDIIGLSMYGKRVFVMSRDGIREIKNSPELVVKSEEWGNGGVLFSVFAANIYVLDKEKNMILRHVGHEGGFNAGDEWLNEGMNVELSGATSWSIDGSIWSLENGRVYKYLQGVPQVFDVSERNTKFDFIFTSEQAEGIYLLDKNGGRVVAFDKTGQYKAEYKSADFSAIDEFVVFESERKIFYLKDGKIFSVEMGGVEPPSEKGN